MEFAILLLIALISKFGDVCMSHNIVEGCEECNFQWYFSADTLNEVFVWHCIYTC